MTRKALARRIAEPYFTIQQRREAPALPQPEGRPRGFWPGALLLVSQRPQRVFSFLLPVRLGPPRTQPKFAAALLYEPQTWCTSRWRESRLPPSTHGESCDYLPAQFLHCKRVRRLGRRRTFGPRCRHHDWRRQTNLDLARYR